MEDKTLKTVRPINSQQPSSQVNKITTIEDYTPSEETNINDKKPQNTPEDTNTGSHEEDSLPSQEEYLTEHPVDRREVIF